MRFSATTRRVGIALSVVLVVVAVVYAVTLVIGLASLTSPQDPIGDPMFSLLEILLILMAPAMVTLMIALHGWASSDRKVLSLSADSVPTSSAYHRGYSFRVMSRRMHLTL
jgi:hypothetical protein